MNAHLGLAYFMAGRLDEAIEQLRRTVQLDPTYIRAYHFSGCQLRVQSMYPEAIETLRKAVSMKGDSLEALPAWRTRSLRLERRQREQRSCATWRAFEEATRFGPRLASLYVALGDHQRALDFAGPRFPGAKYGVLFLHLYPNSSRCAASRDSSASKSSGIQKS